MFYEFDDDDADEIDIDDFDDDFDEPFDELPDDEFEYLGDGDDDCDADSLIPDASLIPSLFVDDDDLDDESVFLLDDKEEPSALD